MHGQQNIKFITFVVLKAIRYITNVRTSASISQNDAVQLVPFRPFHASLLSGPLFVTLHFAPGYAANQHLA